MKVTLYQLPLHTKKLAKKIANNSLKQKMNIGYQQYIAGLYSYMEARAKKEMLSIVNLKSPN